MPQLLDAPPDKPLLQQDAPPDSGNDRPPDQPTSLIERDKSITPEQMERLGKIGQNPDIKSHIEQKYGLRPAVKIDDQVHPGDYGHTHQGVLESIGKTPDDEHDRGFVDKQGKWLNRSDAAKIVSGIDKRDVGGGDLFSEHLIQRAHDALSNPATAIGKEMTRPYVPGFSEIAEKVTKAKEDVLKKTEDWWVNSDFGHKYPKTTAALLAFSEAGADFGSLKPEDIPAQIGGVAAFEGATEALKANFPNLSKHITELGAKEVSYPAPSVRQVIPNERRIQINAGAPQTPSERAVWQSEGTTITQKHPFFQFFQDLMKPRPKTTEVARITPESFYEQAEARGEPSLQSLIERDAPYSQPQVKLDSQTLGKNGSEFLSKNFPLTSKVIAGKTLPLPPEDVHEAITNGVAKGIEAQIRGANPIQADRAALQEVGKQVQEKVQAMQGQTPPKTPVAGQGGGISTPSGGALQPPSSTPPGQPPGGPPIEYGGVPPASGGPEYSINRPFDISLRANDKLTARGIREQFAGIKNEQIVRGNQLADEIKRAVPKPLERQGMFWYKAANGNLQVLAQALDDPKLKDYHAQIQAAMNLSPNAQKMLQKVGQYYAQTGAVSKEIGTIGNVLENYQNRLYLPEKPQDYVKTEMQGLRMSTRHAKPRVFDTELEAAQYGKKFATTDIADALSIHNEEMANVNTTRKMAEALKEKKLASWTTGQTPEGWKEVGHIQKKVAVVDKDGNPIIVTHRLVAPQGIAKGLSAIADPNFTKKIDSLRNLQRYQGLVKTVDLSYSFFHHFSMAMQTLYQMDIFTLRDLPKMKNILVSPESEALARDFALHTGMTTKVAANEDILRNLVQNNQDTFSKIVNLPVVKNVLRGADRSSKFLFDDLQRFFKLGSYGSRVANWVADHPTATNEEVRAAKIGFAKHVNSVYGGLNWEAMGMTKSNLSLLRLGLLAPDWTISNIQLLTGTAQGGTYGGSARKHVLTALAAGTILTEGLNKIMTGHFTDQNPRGHKLEVEISPNVYVSFFRGGIGDIVKLSSMISESGLGGVSRFAQGKLAPLPRTAAGVLTNTQYTGGPIVKKASGPVGGTYDTLVYLLTSAAPLPLGASNFLQYLKKGNATPHGSAAVITGIGRYSKPSKEPSGRTRPQRPHRPRRGEE